MDLFDVKVQLFDGSLLLILAISGIDDMTFWSDLLPRFILD